MCRLTETEKEVAVSKEEAPIPPSVFSQHEERNLAGALGS